jgi:uncharacterized membrane protein
MGRVKLIGLLIALLIIFLPSFTLAQDFSVSPAEVKIDNLPPGEAIEFELTIRNKDEIAHVFTFTLFRPPEKERREGRAEFPDDNWISFSPQKIEVPANYQDNVTVRVAIPPEQKWADKDWEIWLGVASESSDLLAVKLYIRLLVSTSTEMAARFNAGLLAGIVAGVVLLGYGGYYYFRRKIKPK